MKTTAYRGLDKLNPTFRSKVEKFLAEVNKNWNVIFVTESWRSEERQAELLRAGLSQVKRSNHQDWLAIDIWFYWSQLYPSDMKQWRSVADIGKKYWIDWGFDLWKWDKPHFQDNPKILPLTNNNMEAKKTDLTDIMTQVCKDANFKPILSTHAGDQPMTEQRVRELLEIYGARLYKRIMENIKK